MKQLLYILILTVCTYSFTSCKNDQIQPQPAETQQVRKLFYGQITYSSTVATSDSVLAKTLNTFSPATVEIYIDSNKFRMIEFGGLSHGNVIIYTDVKEVWQLDTAKKIAHLGEYSDLGDPSGMLKTNMPDHYAPTVEKMDASDTICGYVCDKFKIVRSGFIPENDEAYIWVAQMLDFPPARYDIQTEINRAAVPAPLYLGYQNGAVMRLQVITKSYSRTFEVTQLKENYFPIGIFEIPANYQKK